MEEEHQQGYQREWCVKMKERDQKFGVEKETKDDIFLSFLQLSYLSLVPSCDSLSSKPFMLLWHFIHFIDGSSTLCRPSDSSEEVRELCQAQGDWERITSG